MVPRFPDLGVEKEFAQIAGTVSDSGSVGTDQLRSALSRPENLYLARQICWVFVAGGVEVFKLSCRDDGEATRLVEALPASDNADRTIQAVVGVAGATDPWDPCATAGLSTVWADQLLTFTVDEFVDALLVEFYRGEGEATDSQGRKTSRRFWSAVTRNDTPHRDTFRAAATDLFTRLTRHSANWGATGADRARNYAALRYSQMYYLAAAERQDGKMLLGVEVKEMSGHSGQELSAVRLIFRSRRTDVVERFQCLIDTTYRFPFLATPLSPVYD